MVGYKYKLNQEVDFNNFQVEGKGIIKGYAGMFPNEVIIEVTHLKDPNHMLPSEYYPFSHIVIPESDIIEA